MAERDDQHIDQIGIKWDAWKLRQANPKLSQEDAEHQAILLRQSRRLRRRRD